jgi:predicted hotdog family 3-hydroxylacyl-ACP dehydratase
MIEKEEIKALIPHRGKMFLLSRVCSFNLDEMSLEAEFDIAEDCIFYDKDIQGIPSWLGIELAAQSFCALKGLERKTQGRAPDIGFIVAVSGLKCPEPVIRRCARIKVRQIESLDRGALFKGEVYEAGRLCSQAAVTVSTPMTAAGREA